MGDIIKYYDGFQKMFNQLQKRWGSSPDPQTGECQGSGKGWTVNYNYWWDSRLHKIHSIFSFHIKPKPHIQTPKLNSSTIHLPFSQCPWSHLAIGFWTPEHWRKGSYMKERDAWSESLYFHKLADAQPHRLSERCLFITRKRQSFICIGQTPCVM